MKNHFLITRYIRLHNVQLDVIIFIFFNYIKKGAAATISSSDI